MSQSYSQHDNIKELHLSNNCYSRRAKLGKLRQQGIAFPDDFHRNAISDQLHTCYDNKSYDDLESLNIEVIIAGRMVSRRIMGKASFITLQDMGGKIQLYVTYNNLPEKHYNEYFKTWDLGDILGARGILFKTRTNELSVYCKEIRLLTKSLRSLPDKFHGLVNQESRYRQRYLDLIANDKSRHTFKTRSRIIAEIRRFMIENNFMEVETPMMQSIPGGASARPFITHHNSLNINMYLRIAPELYLKRLVVGGFEKVFEINRNFRNEGISPCHNPEFTMMELYIAYANYFDLIELVEKLFRSLTNSILGDNIVHYGKHIFDFNKSFTKMSMKEAICYYLPTEQSKLLDNIATATVVAKSIGIQVDKYWKLGRIQTEIFNKIVVRYLVQPTFITSYPVEVTPLARRNDINPFYTDSFELFIGGYEIGNGFSELNDAEDQESRFIYQSRIKYAEDNKDVFFYDEDYITALEYGLPPTSGLGIGIDRLIMLLTNNHNIKDVILFPTLRP